MGEDDRISARAYELWEKAGRPEGDPNDFWYQAELELSKEAAPTQGIGTDDIGDEASAQGFARDMSGPDTDKTIDDETKAPIKKVRSKRKPV